MDPGSDEKKEPGYLRAWKGLAFALVILVLLGILGSYVLRKPVEGTPQPAAAGAAAAPGTATTTELDLRGVQVCLPRVDGSAQEAGACALGLKAEDGSVYGLDTSLLQPDATAEMAGGATVRLTGTFTPASAIADATYAMQGIVQVRSIERIQ